MYLYHVMRTCIIDQSWVQLLHGLFDEHADAMSSLESAVLWFSC